MHPHPVHQDPGRHGIGGIDNRLGEFQASASLLKWTPLAMGKHFEELARDGLTRIAGVPAEKHVRVHGDRRIDQDVCVRCRPRRSDPVLNLPLLFVEPILGGRINEQKLFEIARHNDRGSARTIEEATHFLPGGLGKLPGCRINPERLPPTGFGLLKEFAITHRHLRHVTRRGVNECLQHDRIHRLRRVGGVAQLAISSRDFVAKSLLVDDEADRLASACQGSSTGCCPRRVCSRSRPQRCVIAGFRSFDASMRNMVNKKFACTFSCWAARRYSPARARNELSSLAC